MLAAVTGVSQENARNRTLRPGREQRDLKTARCEGITTIVPHRHPAREQAMHNSADLAAQAPWHVRCCPERCLAPKGRELRRRNTMRRLALLLAASVLGTGCIVTSDNTCDRALDLTWDFTSADNVFYTLCSDAFVNAVDVYVDGQNGLRFDCTTNVGGGTLSVLGGTHVVTVEGVSADPNDLYGDPGVIYYRDQFQVDTSPCGVALMDAHLGEQYVQFQYAFTPDNACTADPSYMWYSLTDLVAGNVISEVSNASTTSGKRTFTCQSGRQGDRPPVIALPAGQYRLDWIEEVVESPVTVFTPAHRNCSPATTIDVPGEYFSNGTVAAPLVTLASSSTACVP
jgi:hypothetical protein